MATDIQKVLDELAETVNYLRETGRIMRRSVERLVEAEEEFIKTNHYLRLVGEHIDRAIDAAIRAQDKTPPE